MPKQKRDWSEVINKLKKNNSGGNFKDERIYKLDYYDDGTARSVVRFLEAPDVDVPIVKQYQHYFNGQGGWLVQPCPTTIGKKCPICEDNSRIWQKGEQGEEYVRKRNSSRKTYYYANVLIIEDKKNPSNEGKVFLFKFGKKIYEKIEECISDGFIPWDNEEGVNFILKSKMVSVKNKKMPNYDSVKNSELPTNLSKYCDDVDELMKKTIPLNEFINPKIFQDYSELNKKFLDVIGKRSDGKETSKKIEKESVKEPVKEEEESFDSEAIFGTEEDQSFLDSINDDDE